MELIRFRQLDHIHSLHLWLKSLELHTFMLTVSHYLHTENVFCWGPNGVTYNRSNHHSNTGSSTVFYRLITHMLVVMRGTGTPMQQCFNTLQLLLLLIIEIYVLVGCLLAVTWFEEHLQVILQNGTSITFKNRQYIHKI